MDFPGTFEDLLTSKITALQTPIADSRSPITVVPEFTTIVLRASGLFIVAVVARRRMVQAA